MKRFFRKVPFFLIPLLFGFSKVLGEEAFHPIHVTFVIHTDPLPAPGGRSLRSSYEGERDNLLWLADTLDQLEKRKGPDFVPRLTLEIAGDHAEYYREDPKGFQLLKRLYQKGIHSFGIHFHTNYKAGEHRWIETRPRGSIGGAVGPEGREDRRKITQDHIEEVDALIGEILGTQEESKIRQVNHIITGHFLDPQVAKEQGFTLRTGGTNEVFNLFFDHDVYQPWRPQFGWGLAEDRSEKDWLLIPQSPVLGMIGEHSPIPRGIPKEYTEGMQRMIWQDLSVPAMKRKFLHLYLEWLYQRKNGLPPKVWVFGWHEHTHNLFGDDGQYGNRRNLRDEVVELVEWLNRNFIASRRERGRPVVQYSNVEEVADEFLKWEKEHPEASSFNYPVKKRDWEAYPYRLKGLAKELIYSHYVEEVAGLGVNAHRLVRTNGRHWRFQSGKIVSSGDLEEIYLFWSDNGSKEVDLSKVIRGEIVCVDGVTGEVMQTKGPKQKVSEIPIVCRSQGGRG